MQGKRLEQVHQMLQNQVFKLENWLAIDYFMYGNWFITSLWVSCNQQKDCIEEIILQKMRDSSDLCLFQDSVIDVPLTSASLSTLKKY